jgi:hypothetical protein
MRQIRQEATPETIYTTANSLRNSIFIDNEGTFNQKLYNETTEYTSMMTPQNSAQQMEDMYSGNCDVKNNCYCNLTEEFIGMCEKCYRCTGENNCCKCNKYATEGNF